MSSALYRSDRHEALSHEFPPEPTSIRIAHPKPCHSACAHDCNECVRARSESVGAEWEVPTTQTFARRMGERVRGAAYASAIERPPYRPGLIRAALCWIAAFALLATPFIWSRL